MNRYFEAIFFQSAVHLFQNLEKIEPVPESNFFVFSHLFNWHGDGNYHCK